MGIIPVPNEWGNNCSACFPVGETPKRLKCFFSGIERGDNWLPAAGKPPNGYHDLLQSDGNPCTWNDDPPTWPSITYTVSAVASFLSCRTTMFATAFISNPGSGCKRGFSNNFKTPVGNIFYGGYAAVITPFNMAAMIAKVTPLADPDPRMEFFPISSSQGVLRYAGKRDATNINFLIDIP